MKAAPLFLAGALVAAPVAAVRIEYTPAEAAQCEVEGGCGIYSAAAIRSLMSEAYRAGRATCAMKATSPVSLRMTHGAVSSGAGQHFAIPVTGPSRVAAGF